MDKCYAIKSAVPICINWVRVICILFFYQILISKAIASFDIQKLRTITTKQCDKPCMNNGYCANGTCACQAGWAGLQCEHCYGRVRINGSTNGFFTDGSFNYSASAKCTWIVTNEQKGPLLLRLEDFSTECCWDNLYVYDGDNAFDNLIGAFSGSLPPATEIVASSGKSIVYFTSDLAFNMAGFNITYQYNTCPGNCSNRGICTNGTCQCSNGYAGDACEMPYCTKDNEPGPCLNQGMCTNGICNCVSYFHGEFCQARVEVPVWDTLYTLNMGNFTPRASHAAVLVDDQLWIYGGVYFSSVKKPNDLVVYNISSKTFSRVQSTNTPISRYDHTMVMYNNKLYLFGGVINQSYITNELWSMEMNSKKWTLEFENDNSPLALPMAVAGHTAHVIGDEMHVFFGYNPYEGYLYQVQIYSFGSRRWRKGKVDPVVSGRFGHSSVLSTNDNEKKHLVYVYGGYNAPINSYSYSISDELLMYDPVDETWTEIGSTGVPLFRHSAVLLNGVIFIYGGNSHNESSSKQSDCFSSKVLAYDTTCQEWMPLNNTDESHARLLPRYGHIAVPTNESFLVFGGFTGQMKNDVLKFTSAQCKSQARDADDCVNSAGGIRCVYIGKSCVQARPYMSYRQSFVNYIKNDNPRLQAICSQQQQQSNNVGKPCVELEDCRSCFSQKGCSWCESTQTCVSDDGCIDGSMLTTDWKNCAISHRKKPSSMATRPCSLSTNCYACRQLAHCSWVTIESKQRCISQIDEAMLIEEQNRVQAERYAAYSRALATTSDASITHRTSDSISFPLTHSLSQNLTCPIPCAQQTSCQRCVIANCMWCGSTHRCVSMDTYMISFPYGQCQSWTTATNVDKNHICQQDPNDCEIQKTCSDCQLVGPRCGWCDDKSGTGLGKCLPGSDSGPYDANSCPLDIKSCQCNGHSNCSLSNASTPFNNPEKCGNCSDRTTGAHCETCIDGYFGDPRNGGECRECQCNNQARSCDPESGDCYCTTKGVTGPHYKHVNQINFYSTPFKRDTDVQFSITCEGETNAKVAINLTSNFFEGQPANMKPLMANTSCTASGIKRTYSASSPDYAFGTEANTTFLVRVYDFATPIKIQISFAQSPPINWVLFFVIFAACFIVLLVVAGLLWMIKLRVEWYRNLRRRHDEIEEMASRPFGSVQLELLMNKNDLISSPVCIEPLANYEASIYTIIVRLPTGGKEYTPNGTSGLAVASSLCLLTQAQLALLQPPDSADQRTSRKSTLRRFIPFMRS